MRRGDANCAGSNQRFHGALPSTRRRLRSAVISIASNDADESPYEFAVQGAGVNTGEETLWPDTKTGRDVNFDGTYYELGTVFRPTIAGKITHLRVYSLASETGDHTARVWRNDDETIIGGPYTWTYGGTTGWITLDIPDLDVAADTDYTVSVSTGTSAKRNYPNLAADLTAPGSNGQHLPTRLTPGFSRRLQKAGRRRALMAAITSGTSCFYRRA